MSRVFLALETALGRRVVLKVCPPEFAALLNGERFQQEVRVVARMQHPHIVPLLAAGRAGDSIYYSMPLIDGESLRARLEREVEVPVPDAIRILREIADALAYAHASGFVHRDIKPDNILLAHGHAVVADFGIVKALTEAGGDTLTATGVSLGTPAYIAPEQAVADPHVDHRADLYSLGVVAYEMLAGTPPFEGGTGPALIAAHLSTAPLPLATRRPTVPPALAQIVHRCLEKHPADRFRNAAELVAALDALTVTVATASPAPIARSAASPAPSAARAWPTRRILGYYAVAAVALMAIAWIIRTVAGLPDWFVLGAAALLVIGFPVVAAAATAHNERIAGAERMSLGIVGRRLTLRGAVVGGVAAFSFLGLGTGSYMGMRTMGIGSVGTLVARGTLAARERLIVAEFENSTGDSLLGPALTDAFRIDFAESRLVTLVEGDYVRRALVRMQRPATTPLTVAVAREIAQREGVKAVVRGTVQPVASAWLISGEIRSAETGEVLASARETARDSTRILDAVDAVSRRLRERIGESLRTIRANPPLAEATTGSLDALRSYSQALRAGAAGDQETEIALLEDAVATDSGFAMAWRRLGTLLFNRGERGAEAEAAVTRAFRLRGQLSFRERMLTANSYYSDISPNTDSAVAALEALLREHPNDAWALNNLGVHYAFVGNRDAAAEMYRRAIAVDSLDFTSRTNVFFAEIGAGQFDSAAVTLRRIITDFPPSPAVDELEVLLALGRRDYETAERVVRIQLERYRTSPATSARLRMMLAGTLLIRGKLAEGDRALVASAEFQAARGAKGVALAERARRALPASMYLGDSVAARATIGQALNEIPLEDVPPRERPMGRLIAVGWAIGDRALAESWLREFEAHRGVEPGRARRYVSSFHRARVLMMDSTGFEDALALLRGPASGPCPACSAISFAQLFDRAGMVDSALAHYERWATVGESEWSPIAYYIWQPLAYHRMAELYEARGDSARAVAAYERFAEIWRDADPVLQPRVIEARRRAAALGSDRGR
jgi:tetratricopeptide (TPR) repeat protein